MKTVDAAVIGGGVIGACVAYYLARENLRVVLLERGDIASGTSGHGEGNVLIHDKQPGIDTQMAYASQRLFETLAAELSCDFEYVQRGSVLLIESEEEQEAAEALVARQVRDGYPMRMLSQAEIHAQEPFLAEDILGAVEIDCDAALNPMAFAFGLCREAERLGALMRTYSPVRHITRSKEGAVRSVETAQEVYRTKYVINCAGVWAGDIGRMVGLNIPIEPRQGQLLVAERTFPVANRKMVEFGYMMAKFGDSSYRRKVSPDLERMGIAFVFEPTRAGNFLIGSSRAFVGYDTDVSMEVMKGLASRALRFFSVLSDINVIRAYAGLRPYCPDHFPIVSAVEDVPGFYIAAGHEGDGVGLSPITGKLIAEMIAGRQTSIPIEHLRFSRFRESDDGA
jgi:glycine/D-amino acid oxidase-like deaminating enzyme